MLKLKSLLIPLVILSTLFTSSKALADQVGRASWYGPQHHGRRMANGQIFNQWSLTCASNSYRLGTILQVTNLRNGRTVRCRVTDRGGFTRLGRIIDLSRGSFRRLASEGAGVIRVRVRRVN